MRKQSSKSMLRAALMLMALLVLTFTPVFASAEGTDGEGGEAQGIKVYLTVSNQGNIATTKDGETMTWKEVTVTDLDASGDYTFYEALVAAHKAYNSEDGLDVSSSGWVNALWGVANNPAGYYFIQNGKPTDLVTETKVVEGDYLTASVSQDTELSADWACAFDKTAYESKVGEEFSLTLTGFPSMTMSEAVPSLKPVSVGVWKDGSFTEMAKTDDAGKVSLTFDEPGTYIVTAAGKANGLIESDEYYPFMKVDHDSDGKPIWGKMDWNTYATSVAYFEKDYGEGPYPYEELIWFDWEDFDNTQPFTKGYLMYTGRVYYDCPVVAPCCIVTVPKPADPADVKITVNNKGVFAKAKDGTAMVEKDLTVTDFNKDGILTYDDALFVAHETYFEGGKAGYSGGPWISKFWGQDTGNTLMYNNDETISPAMVDTYEVKAGDKLYASINADDIYYWDWFTLFDNKEKTVGVGESFTLNLKGHYGMAYLPEDMVNVPVEGIDIGTWKDGAFQAIEGVKTDAEGNASISFADPGIYIVTAQGTVKDMVEDYSDYPNVKTVEADCPIMPPYCIVTVTKSLAAAEIKVASATYTGKNLTPAVTVKLDGVELTKDKDYSVTYENNKNAGKNAKVTVSGKGVYLETASKTFTIKKAKQPMVVKITNKSFKAKDLKKKAKSYKAVTVTKNQGAVTYKVTLSKTAKKALRFAKGKITVKKKAKKGTYKVKVKITAKGNANYLSGYVNKVIKVKVK